jgi:hypothetical protein
MSQKSLRKIYFSDLYSTMSYGIILGGNLPYSNSIFKIQKRIIRIITYAGYTASCSPLFKKLNIPSLYPQYTFSLSTLVKNTDAFKLNSAVHSITTKQGLDLHLPITNLTKAQKGV